MHELPVNYHFRWVSAYQGTLKFTFHTNGADGSFLVRRDGFSCREGSGSSGGLYDFSHPSIKLSKAFVDAFNDWAMQDHMRHVAHMSARAHVYGSWDQCEALVKPPRPVQGFVRRNGEHHPLPILEHS